MEMTLRWYGPGYDSVTLKQIRQIPGVKNVISIIKYLLKYKIHVLFLCYHHTNMSVLTCQCIFLYKKVIY